MSSEPPETYHRDAATWAAFACLFGFGLLNAVLGPALPFLRASEHLGYLTASAHQVGFAIGGGLAGALTPALTRRLSRRRAVAGGLLVAALALLGVGYGRVAPVTVAASLLLSLAGTSALIRLWALLADIHRERRTVAMSEGEVCVSLAGVLTPLLVGGLAATALSWRSAFVVAALVVLCAVLVLFRVPLPSQRSDATTRPHLSIGDWRQVTLAIVVAIVALEFSLSFWLASYLHDDVGIARSDAAALVSLLYAAALVGRVVVSRLARRVSPERLLAVALVVTLVGAPAVLLARGPALAVVGILVVGAGTGATFPITSSLHVQASSLGSDQAIGQVLLVAALGETLGPLATGVVAQVADLRTGLIAMPVFSVVALLVLTTARRRGTGPTSR